MLFYAINFSCRFNHTKPRVNRDVIYYFVFCIHEFSIKSEKRANSFQIPRHTWVWLLFVLKVLFMLQCSINAYHLLRARLQWAVSMEIAFYFPTTWFHHIIYSHWNHFGISIKCIFNKKKKWIRKRFFNSFTIEICFNSEFDFVFFFSISVCII